MKFFNFLWINYTIFTTLITIRIPFLVSLTSVPISISLINKGHVNLCFKDAC